MHYLSTRGEMAPVPFDAAVMMGLARDKGLLLPTRIPDVHARLSDWRHLPYPELAVQVLREFTGAALPEAGLRPLVQRSYATFTHPAVAPLVRVGDRYILELFHGPTLAFKDIALQVLGNLFERFLPQHGGQLNLLGATSGDTGSAAIYGVRGKAGMHIFILHPHGRVSPVQERQMTTVLDANVHNLAIRGTFDDGQRIVKELFGDLAFRDHHHLGAVNSVNWARVLSQIVYYFHAAFRATEQSGAERVRICVPTGNFGNIFAGWMAVQMGAPISQLILATNENDILARFFRTGSYQLGGVHETLSPSMDIQVASNFERFLYYLLGEQPAQVRAHLAAFGQTGRMDLAQPGQLPASGAHVWGRDVLGITAGVGDRAATLAAIRDTYAKHRYVLDPHTAVGVAVAATQPAGDPIVCLATAHPAKFAAAVREATGRDDLAHHPAIDALATLPTRCAVIPAETSAVRAVVEQTLGR